MRLTITYTNGKKYTVRHVSNVERIRNDSGQYALKYTTNHKGGAGMVKTVFQTANFDVAEYTLSRWEGKVMISEHVKCANIGTMKNSPNDA